MKTAMILLAIFATTLGGCATRELPVEAASRPESGAASSTDGSLPPQTLAPGVCGLFLWTPDAPSRFVFFMRAGEMTAKVQSPTGEESLVLIEQGGGLMGQFATNMRYQATSAGKVRLTFSAGEQIDGGQRIQNGRIVFLDHEGWETIMPVIGIAACEPKIKEQ